MYGPYFIHVTSSGSVLRALRGQSITHFNKTGGGGYLQFLPMMEVLIEREGLTAESGLIQLLWELAFQDANEEYTKPRMATAITTHCVPFLFEQSISELFIFHSN